MAIQGKSKIKEIKKNSKKLDREFEDGAGRVPKKFEKELNKE